MSTSELFLSDEEVHRFIEATRKHPQCFIGDEDEGDVEYGVCPFITFYIHHQREDFERIARSMIEVHQALQGMIDRPYRKVWKDSTQVWLKAGDKRLPTDLYEELRKTLRKEDAFWIQATDKDSPSSSARWAIQACVTNNPTMRYSTLKITFRHEWYLQNRATWEAFVAQWLAILQPDQCYSGFEIGSTASGAMGSYESDVMERITADYFYGLDIDHPGDMGFHYRDDPDGWVNVSDLSAGLRSPTWCFLLSPYWMGRLGLDEEGLYQALPFSNAQITPIRHMDARVSYWIRLGELALHPVEDGVPPLLAAASKLIRPVRCNKLNLLSLDPWDDDPNPRFDTISGPRWMGRFDDDSDWPSPEVRHPQAPTAPANVAQTPISAMPGEAVPRAGVWQTPALLENRTLTLAAGETLPYAQTDKAGNAVVWFWKAE